MKKALTHSELNNVLIENMVEFLTIAQDSPDMEEQERSYVNNDLDYIEVAFFGKQPDGENQWSIHETGETINFEQAFNLLVTRINNSCFINSTDSIEESEIEREEEFGTHKVEFEYEGEQISFEIKPTAEDWWTGVEVKTEKSEFYFEVNYDVDYNTIAIYLKIDGDTIHSQIINPNLTKYDENIDGQFDNDEESKIDLFESSHLLPVKVQEVINRYGELDEPTYDNCEAMLKELEPLGYTFGYELDATPYDLRPIEQSVSLKLIADILNAYFGKSVFEYDQSWLRVQNITNRYERNDITLTYDKDTSYYQITLTGIKTNPETSLVAINQIISLYDNKTN
jgi:hypothetical protein